MCASPLERRRPLPPIRVLLVEDREDDALLLIRELERAGYDFVHERVETLRDLRAAMQAQPWDIVISDFSLPTMTALDVLAALAEMDSDIPCVVLSGSIAEESAAEVFRAGARDFVVKDRMTRLVPAIRRELAEAVDRRRRRDAERALQDARDRMQFVIETIGVGTWERDLRTDTLVWSEAMEQLHGLPRGSFDQTVETFLTTVHPDDRELVVRPDAATGHPPAKGRLEYRVVAPDGSVRWIASFGRTIDDAHGRPQQAVGIAIDITAQKNIEEQLRQAQKLDAIGQLAGGVAHDFNNLLTAIIGYADLAAEMIAEEGLLAQNVQQIRKAGDRGAALTRQLLAFSRQQMLEPALVDLSALVTDMSHMLRRLIREHVVTSTKLGAELGLVRADRSQIEQIVLNLAVNARDAMPRGGHLTIETADVHFDDTYALEHATVEPGDYVMLAVHDTGIGMSEETRRHIFEPFFTTKEKGKGTGLGLSTVYGIVKQSGGHVYVYSELGHGTTFRIYLPRAQGAVATERPAETQAAPAVGTERLLIVEDEEAVRALSCVILEQAGYTVVEVDDPRQAEDSFTPDVDLVISDIIMPGTSGPVLYQQLARRKPGLKVLFVSGYVDETLLRESALEPGTAFLQKPFTKSTLLKKVREVLDAG